LHLEMPVMDAVGLSLNACQEASARVHSPSCTTP
jgi:hypothetical protein